MRLGIQAKLITTLILAGLLPLVVSLLVVLLATLKIRTNTVGQSFQGVAQQGAEQLSTMLSAQVEFIWLLSHLPGTDEFLASANAIPPLSPEQISEIERRWPNLAEDDPLLKPILDNRLARRWQTVHDYQRRFAEVLITDASGRLVAATNKTSDYYQADEPWWQECHAGGNGRIFLSDITWDESAISMRGSTGAIVATLCVPIRNPADENDGHVIGVMKISLDAGWLVQHLSRLSPPTDTGALIWLVQANGKMIPDGFGASIARVPDNLMDYIRNYRYGWTRDSGIDGKELLGFAAVEMPRGEVVTDNVQWHVLVAASRQSTLGPIYRLSGIIGTVGAAFIAFCFCAGFFIARREIVQPLKMLSKGALELERGNVGYRLPVPPTGSSNEHFRQDEIGSLARDFNRMADHLERNVKQLHQTDEMKRQFIDLASHELRTPVTYILGVSELALRQNTHADPVMEKIAAKAHRLNHIVDNMFKLLGTGSYQMELNRTPIDLKTLALGVCQELDPFLLLRNQRWDLQIIDHLPPIEADAEKLHDVLLNLLSNAIRFSPDGQPITLRVSTVETDIQIDVIDRGNGIPADDLPRLFEPFFTSDAGELMRHTSGEYAHMSRGIGLGLSVVKRFVELHGGTVAVGSSPSEGTTFTVKLPMKT
jgi:signal transduction histidine kinase